MRKSSLDGPYYLGFERPTWAESAQGIVFPLNNDTSGMGFPDGTEPLRKNEQVSVRVVLRHDGTDYTFVQELPAEMSYGAPLYRYMYEEGNYSCDCNRADFIARYCDEDFPEMDCGITIELVSLTELETLSDGGKAH